ncbi:MAG: hypothetical protein MZV64_14660 [Ignavibacteriales bacterium]|nr:hypothetical protein [Ignavibacteriales bacterium]
MDGAPDELRGRSSQPIQELVAQHKVKAQGGGHRRARPLGHHQEDPAAAA